LSVSVKVAAEDVCEPGSWSQREELRAHYKDRRNWLLPGITTTLHEVGLRLSPASQADVQVEILCTRPANHGVEVKIAGGGEVLETATVPSCGRGDDGWVRCVAMKAANVVLQSPTLRSYAAARRTRSAATVAQTRAATLTAAPPAATPRSPALLAGSPQRTAFALIVGIERYREQMPVPAGARGDAERFAEVARTTLGIPARNVRLALDDRATKTDIEKHLAWLKANVPAGGRIYFYFSGHGAPEPSKGTSYLLPYDGDPSAVEQTGVRLAKVLEALSRTRAKEVLAFVDSCFSGAGGRSVLPPGARPLVVVKGPTPVANVVLLSASSGNEISGPMPGGRGGVFSHYLTQGLGLAEADLDADGQITLHELYTYLKPRVAREAQRENRAQTPALITGARVGAAENLVVTWGVGRER
jgi:hypothetical protein